MTGRWVIISTDRARRPTDFVRAPVTVQGGRICPFCPGNEQKTPPELLAYREGSAPNSPGWRLRCVPNKFPALRVEGDLDRRGDGVYDLMNGIGAHEVFVESPDHFATLSEQSERQIEELLWAFRDRTLDLKRDHRLQYVLLFKNYGEAAGATLEHTHSQLIALPIVPRQVQEEMDGALRYFQFRDRCVFCDMIRQDSTGGQRMVLETDQFLVMAPYAPRFPFETWILPRRHASHFESADHSVLQNLAWVLRSTLRRIDQVLERPAYNLVIHSAPLRESAMGHYHWHIEIIPKLTKAAGFEWGTGFHINPTPPEEAAQFLRDAL